MGFKHAPLDGSDNEMNWKHPMMWIIIFFVFILPLVIVPFILSFYIGDLAYRLVVPTIIITAGYSEMLRYFNYLSDR